MRLSKNSIKMLKTLKMALTKVVYDYDPKHDVVDRIYDCETDGHSNTVNGDANFNISTPALNDAIRKSCGEFGSLEELIGSDAVAWPLNLKVIYNYNNTQVADADQADVIWDDTYTHKDLLEKVTDALKNATVKA